MRPGCLFLNNRYHDPTLGTFISVDPLVTVTGEPYIYASGNPTTLSDPSGLATCINAGGVVTGYNKSDCTGSDQEYASHIGEDLWDECRAACDAWRDDGWREYLSDGARPEEVPLDLEWAGCMRGAGVRSCGTPAFAEGGGEIGKGPHSYHQAWWCLVHGNCKQIWDNNWLARGQLETWRNSPEFRNAPAEDLNALLHAFWFALNASSYLEVSDEALRDFGIAHEQDWRDGVHDVARDLLNNEVGIGLGAPGLSYDEVVSLIEDAALSGQLSCVSGEQVTSCSFAG